MQLVQTGRKPVDFNWFYIWYILRYEFIIYKVYQVSSFLYHQSLRYLKPHDILCAPLYVIYCSEYSECTSLISPRASVFEEKNLFEYLQKNLEEKTDCLHEMLEKDLDKSFFDQENQPTSGSEEAHQKFMTFRSHATNFTNVTQKFLTQILSDLGSETGLGQKVSQSSVWTRAALLPCPVTQCSVMNYPASPWCPNKSDTIIQSQQPSAKNQLWRTKRMKMMMLP